MPFVLFLKQREEQHTKEQGVCFGQRKSNPRSPHVERLSEGLRHREKGYVVELSADRKKMGNYCAVLGKFALG